jgi:pSer/pThr/pTyr-binding forkhead associated (FHA) protein
METVQEYIETLAQLGTKAFLAKYSTPVILYQEKHDSKGFATGHTRMVDYQSGTGILQNDQELRKYRVLLPKCPDTGKIPNKFLVGRSEDREFNIDHSTVSKRHAFILLIPDKNTYQLGDAGSTNGTLLDGQAVKTGEPVALKDGDNISFGDCDFLFFSPQGFVDLMKRL